jgi:hippurate hydrolase
MPAAITVTGTARSYTPAVRDLLERRMGELAQALAAMHGATAEYQYARGVPATVNHPEQTAIARQAAAALVGAAAVGEHAPITGAEDFSLMLEARPGAFMFIGGGEGPEGKSANLHTPQFDFNDAIIPLGVGYWASVVEQELGSAAG